MASIDEYPMLKYVFNIRSFVGFLNNYRYFIWNLLNIVSLQTALTEGVKFQWPEKEQKVFETLKEVFMAAVILKHFVWTQPVVVETDALDLISARVL